MCGRNVSLLSRVTPSVLIVFESGTAVPVRLMLESKGKTRRHCYKPNKAASDLSGFMANPLKQSHAYMDERHSSSFSSPDWSVCDWAIWSCISSAYCGSWIHFLLCNILPELIWIWNDVYEMCAKKHFWKEHLCAFQFLFCELVSRPVCACKCAQLRGNIDY